MKSLGANSRDLPEPSAWLEMSRETSLLRSVTYCASSSSSSLGFGHFTLGLMACLCQMSTLFPRHLLGRAENYFGG